MTEIPTEALEAAAVAAYASDLNDSVDHGWKWPMPSWSQLPPDARDSLRDKVRPVLAAAAPYLIAEGRRQAAEAVRAADTEQWGPTARAADVRDCQERAARIAEGGDHG